MAVDVKVPVLAESVAEATLLTWHRKVGDAIKRGDTLIDIETDKVTLEVAAPADGVLAEILKPDGSTAVSDEVIARIDSAARAERPAEKTAAPAAKPAAPEQAAPIATAAVGEEPRLSPAVRAMLDEHNLDPNKVAASGPGGRLTKEDVLKYLKETQGAAPAPAPAPKVEPTPAVPKPQPAAAPAKPAAIPTPPRAATAAPTPAPAPVSAASGRAEQRVPMTRLRRRAAERLLQAQQQNAILTTFNEINMQPVTDLRSRYKEAFEQAHGVKLGFMSFFTKAATEALKKFPVINARVDGTDIIYNGYFDVGIAVGAARGLVVPILRDADQMSLAELETKIRELGEKAKNGKLTIEELTGGTFTITNGGVFGSLLSTPIINPPQSAILGMHKIQSRPVAENNAVVIRPMMYVALSYDHRIIDGREAVQFLVSIKELIEDPSRLLLQV